MKVLTVVGARPQFVKAGTVSRAFRHLNASAGSEQVREVLVHTGQHFDRNMSEVFFSQLDIPEPDHHLGIASLGHGAMTGRMLESIESLVIAEAPDWMLVYGDTNSTLAGALAAAKLHVPIVHVEAGLRSHNPAMPEEINRVLTDRVSSLLCCPTREAVDNLDKEGFPFACSGREAQRIENTGDVMYDATDFYRARASDNVDLGRWGIEEGGYALCTLHRAENTNDAIRLEAILSALGEINRDIPVVLPLHPRTRGIVDAQGLGDRLGALRVLEPVPYLEMQRLEMGARTILTDSGGVQKEAFFYGVPCITLRDETEWRETVELGWNRLAGADTNAILDAFHRADRPEQGEQLPYGDGNAAERIVRLIMERA